MCSHSEQSTFDIVYRLKLRFILFSPAVISDSNWNIVVYISRMQLEDVNTSNDLSLLVVNLNSPKTPIGPELTNLVSFPSA